MTRVLVAGDIRLYRDGLAFLLAQRAENEVATASAPGEALARALDWQPECVLLDMAMAGSDELVDALLERVPNSKIVALAVGDSDADILACAEAGVAGYVTRDGSIDDLWATVDSVGRDEMICSPHVAAALMRRVRALSVRDPAPGEGAVLTARELEIVELIDLGLSNKEIATRLSIGVATVKNHVHHVLEKLGVHRRADAAAFVRSSRRLGRAGVVNPRN